MTLLGRNALCLARARPSCARCWRRDSTHVREGLFKPERRVVNRPVRRKQPRSKAASISKSCTWSQETAPGCAGDEKCDWSSEKSRLHRKDHVRLPEALPKHHRQAAKHEGEQMHHALEAGGLGRERRAACGTTSGSPGLRSVPVELAAVVFADAPGRVIGRRCRRARTSWPRRAKPGCHLAGVFTDACQFWGVVEAVDQNSHCIAVYRTRGFCQIAFLLRERLGFMLEMCGKVC